MSEDQPRPTVTEELYGADDIPDDFRREFAALCDDRQEVALLMPKVAFWALLCQVQLASRHPENTGPTRRIAESYMRAAQEETLTTPALAQVAEQGWHQENDR